MLKVRFSHFLLISILCITSCGQDKAQEQKPRPNIIIIMADDMGYGDPTCYNADSKIPTPNMDRLSREGVLFTDAHTPSSVCTPTRYGLLTGSYAWRSSLKKGVLWSGYDNPLITPEQPNLAKLFKEAGYTTGVVGKWHLGINFLQRDSIKFVSPKIFHEKGLKGTRNVDFNSPTYNGPNYLGFDYAFVSAAGHNMEPFAYIENDFVVGKPTLWHKAKVEMFPGVSAVGTHDGWMVEGWDPRKVGPDLVEKAETFIKTSVEATPEKPFFLYFPTVSPHLPCTPPDFAKGKSEAGVRGDMVFEFDWAVGQIMELLDELKIADNTILIVTSDNGGTPASDDGNDYGHDSSGKLRGFKGTLDEGGHRVPLLMRWPEQLPQGETNDGLVCLTDFYATFADFLGVDEKEAHKAPDSFNLLPLLKEKEQVREALVMHDYSGNFAIRKGGWKLKFRGNKAKELYNLDEDLKEANNLLDKYPEKAEALKKLLQKYKWEGKSSR